MELKAKQVLVVGLGVSGLAAAELCLRQGALVVGLDQDRSKQIPQPLLDMGLILHLGEHCVRDFLNADLVVLSPGVDSRLPELEAARAKGAEVIGELELGFRFLKSKSIMITGSNGKTTVTKLIAELLSAQGRQVFSGGNLGTPLCSMINQGLQPDWAVLEVSSFQTDTAFSIRPEIGVILNITPDHLDRYKHFDQYARSKFNMLARQTGSDLAILCLDDKTVREMAHLAPATVWGYSALQHPHPGGWVQGQDLILAPGNEAPITISTQHSRLPGTFNKLNLLAACLAAYRASVEPAVMQKVIDSFAGLPHRLQWVRRVDEVDYYNDSKGTNLGAVIAAVQAMERPVVLLLGGRDKNGHFADLVSVLDRISGVVCFGEAAWAICEQLAPWQECHAVPDLPCALELAKNLAAPGQVVLLSPGCASFDAYANYAARGDDFIRLVMEL